MRNSGHRTAAWQEFRNDDRKIILHMEKIFIKNMVCRRCIIIVSNIFRENGITPLDVELGTVTLPEPLPAEKMKIVKGQLEEYGFEILDDRRMRIIEQIRTGVIEYIRNPEISEKVNLSEYLQGKCHKEYSALSKLFSEMKGISIERYQIAQKIELVKELLIYDELNISEIADRLHYSSTAHLSAQFKSVTGISPTQFKKAKERRLNPLDEI